jgi:excisionase family DNA binding protein
MNAEIKQLFAEYLLDAEDHTAAAVLVLADVLCRPTPEPIVIEPDDRQTLSVREAAARLNTSSKGVYQMGLAGQLRCVRLGGRVRVPVEEVERHEAAPHDA